MRLVAITEIPGNRTGKDFPHFCFQNSIRAGILDELASLQRRME